MAEVVAKSKGHSNRWVVLALVCLAQLMVVLDATIVNVALFNIQTDLKLKPADLQWVVNSYALVFGGFLMLGGRAADLYGRKKLFLIGIVIFTLASLMNGLATSAEFLIFSRGLQGLGAAFVSPAALSVVTTTFAEGPDRTKAMGVWSGIAAGGAAVGLLLGGILTDLLSWEWIFFVNVPIGIAAFILSYHYVPESHAELEHRSFDLFGAITVTAGMIALVYGTIKSTDWHWTGDEAHKTYITLGIAAALLITFVIIEMRVKAPLVRLGIFKTRSLTVANISMLLVAAGMFAMFYFNSLYVRQILGYSPIRTGLAFLPVALCIGLGAGLSQVSVKKVGVRAAGMLGLIVATAGMFLLAGPGTTATGIDINGSYWQNLFPGLLVMAVGMGLTFVPLTLLATTGVNDEDAGLASGLLNTSQQIGGAIGLAVLTTVSVNTFNDSAKEIALELKAVPTEAQLFPASVDGWSAAFIGGAYFLLAGLIILGIFLRPKHVENVSTDPSDAMVA